MLPTENAAVLHNMSAPARSKINFGPLEVTPPADAPEKTDQPSPSGFVCLAIVNVDGWLGISANECQDPRQSRLLAIALRLLAFLSGGGSPISESDLRLLSYERLHDCVLDLSRQLPRPNLPGIAILGQPAEKTPPCETLETLHILTHANGKTYVRDGSPILPALSENFCHGLWAPQRIEAP